MTEWLKSIGFNLFDGSDYFNQFAIYLAVFGGVLSAWLGGYDELVALLLNLVVADFVMGVLAAFKHKTVNSREIFWGSIRKIIMFVVVALAFKIQQLLPEFLALREITLYFYIVKEGLSFVENTGKLIELPVIISQFFQQLQGKNNTEQTKLLKKESADDEKNHRSL